MEASESQVYADPVIHAQTTPYQRIVLTASRHDLRLFLNGNLQFSSRDEYRYHEALVHPAMAAVAHPRRVLIFGGGDGLAAREVLRWPEVESITQVELDPAMVRLFSAAPLAALNGGVLRLAQAARDQRRRLRVAEAAGGAATYDVVIVDFPDPSNYSIGKLYSLTFFRLLRRALAPGGAAVVQSTSPFVARQTYWCVVATLEAAGLATVPYHLYVPSFGEWGFVMASAQPMPMRGGYPAGLRYVTPATVADMQRFPPDMSRVPAEVNRLDSQALVRYFEAEWAEYGVN